MKELIKEIEHHLVMIEVNEEDIDNARIKISNALDMIQDAQRNISYRRHAVQSLIKEIANVRQK